MNDTKRSVRLHSLSALSFHQRGEVMNWRLQLALEFKLGKHNTGDFTVTPDTWFWSLTEHQMEEVIAYYRSIPFRQNAMATPVVLTWYRSVGAFRFESTIYPV